MWNEAITRTEERRKHTVGESTWLLLAKFGPFVTCKGFPLAKESTSGTNWTALLLWNTDNYINQDSYCVRIGREKRKKSITGLIDKNGIKYTHSSFCFNFWSYLLKIEVWKSRKQDCGCCHFVPRCLYEWRHEQGRHMQQKCQTRQEPTFFFLFFFKASLLKSEPTWLPPQELIFDGGKVLLLY